MEHTTASSTHEENREVGGDLRLIKRAASHSSAKVTGSKSMSDSQTYPVGFGQAFAASMLNPKWGLLAGNAYAKAEAKVIYEHFVMPRVLQAWSENSKNVVSTSMVPAVAEDPSHINPHTGSCGSKSNEGTQAQNGSGSHHASSSASSNAEHTAKRLKLACPGLPSKPLGAPVQDAAASKSSVIVVGEDEPDDSGRLDGDWYRAAGAVPSPIERQSEAHMDPDAYFLFLISKTLSAGHRFTSK